MHGLDHGRSSRQGEAPALHLRQAVPETEFVDGVEHIEVTEHGPEDRVDDAECAPRKEVSGTQRAFELRQAASNVCDPR
ncbi:hypothetical protein D9M68_994440 [compost metagenome]